MVEREKHLSTKKNLHETGSGIALVFEDAITQRGFNFEWRRKQKYNSQCFRLFLDFICSPSIVGESVREAIGGGGAAVNNGVVYPVLSFASKGGKITIQSSISLSQSV